MRCILPLIAAGVLLAGGHANAACDSPAHRQFDFWIGEWTVENPDGEVIGHNTIEAVMGGCVLHETWTGKGGNIGQSLNGYHAGRGQWHQAWMDNRGLVLELDGGLEDGSMVLSGERRTRAGDIMHERITWTPEDNGSVTQLWERSGDGKKWEVVFVGVYRKADRDE